MHCLLVAGVNGILYTRTAKYSLLCVLVCDSLDYEKGNTICGTDIYIAVVVFSLINVGSFVRGAEAL